MRNHLMLACAAAALVAATHAYSQAYPSKPIRIVVPFAPGGPADITARTIGPRMTELLGQPIIVDNRGGANGVIGAENAIRSPPDGYTLLQSTSSITAINMVTYGDKPPYDTLRDLQPLTPVMFTTSLIVLHPSMPTKTLKELVALMKSRPNQITFGSAGTGGTLHFGIEMLQREAGVKITHVPFKGAGPAVTDLIGGQINGMFVDLPVISPYVKSGKVRALAVTSVERSQYFPEIPTTKEAGYPGVEMTNCYGLLVPAKTPRDIVMKLHDAVVKAVATPAVRERFIAVGADPATMSPEEFTRFIKTDIDKWGKLAKAAGIVIER
ncbi:MAG: LacI family transcriptional regulator [Betaproteobacteria bacterium]|jgi:tripartite-type tricarboxylate transporter receptor subunit TctC|nr:LacI family transcriptional regulator [Betaproteobacteria bacterium]